VTRLIVTGVMVGGIYALVALGWVLIYKCSGVLNLAMGEMTLIGAYISISFYSMGVPFLLALLLSLVIGLALGILTERIFLDRLIGQPVLAVIMVTVGLSLFSAPAGTWASRISPTPPPRRGPCERRACARSTAAGHDAWTPPRYTFQCGDPTCRPR